MRSLFCLILLTSFTLCLAQPSRQPLNLWPADAGKVAVEKVVAGKGDSVKRIPDIHQATITPFRVAVPPDEPQISQIDTDFEEVVKTILKPIW